MFKLYTGTKILTNAYGDYENAFGYKQENKINLPTDPQVFIISDTHLGHNNIINYCFRPFKDAEEMDKTIINNWNNIVRPQDIVIHCGDFCLGKGGRNKVADSVKFYRKQLNGKIILILGNHDDKRCAYIGECGFEAAFFHYHKFVGLMCCHSLDYPPKDEFNNVRFTFYGHVHNNDLDPINFTEKRCNICVEEVNYTPFNITPFLTEEEYFAILKEVKGN